VNAGTLVAGTVGAFGSGVSLYQAGGSIDVTTVGANAANLTVSAGRLRLGTNGALSLSGAATFTGGILRCVGNGRSGDCGPLFFVIGNRRAEWFSDAWVNPDSTNYYVNVGTGGIDLQRRATVGTATLSTGTSDVIVGGTVAIAVSVLNNAPVNSDALSFTAGGTGGLITGSLSGSGVVAGGTSASTSGLVFTGGTVGAAQSGTVRVTGVGTTNSTVDSTLSVNVFDHASGTASGTLITIADVFVGYGGPLAGGSSTTVSNASGYRVPLKLTGTTTSGSLSLSSLNGVVAGGTGSVTASLASGHGAGALDQTFTLNYADDSALSGGSSALGTLNIRVTGNAWDHASTAFSGGTLSLGNVRLGYGIGGAGFRQFDGDCGLGLPGEFGRKRDELG